MLTLYGSPRSRALRSIWMLYELGEHVGERFELVPVDPRSTAFPVAVNPNRKVPALVDGDTTMWESMAINLYLAQTRTTPLSPRGRRELGDVLKWTLCAQSELEESFNGIARLEDIPPEWPRKVIGALETTLQGRDYLLGTAQGSAAPTEKP
jgi:glutathione S-transferase